ncbi:MAG TPA: PadR family transcriptional regulator [Thermodesulfobacteriota bacterium]|nr:PadR family transcriptional regulator [Thermodesulfobacteriota bacterium]
MSLPHALLGLISYKPSTGYDLKNTFKNSIHFFWNAALPHIYRTLKQMEGQGWITATIEHQDGKPSRKVYQLTEAGGRELHRWLSEPPEAPEPRLPLLVKVFFGNQMPADQFREHIKQWRDYHEEVLRQFDAEVLPIIEKFSNRSGLKEEPFFWGLTLDFGRRHAQMVIDWCDQILKEVEPAKGKKKKETKSKSQLNPSR